MGTRQRTLLVLALLGWLVPAAATVGTDNPLREGIRRLVRTPAPPDPWREALRDVGDRLPQDHDVAIWLDRLPETPDAAIARGYLWISAAYRLYPRRVFPLAPMPVVDTLDARGGLVGPSVVRLMRERLGALARGERLTLALLVWDGDCKTAGPPGTPSIRALLTFGPGRCLLIVGGAAN